MNKYLLPIIACFYLHTNLNAQVYELDQSFNTTGKTILDINKGFDGAYSIQVSNVDEVYILGYSNDINGKSSMVLAKYKKDGSLDGSFADGGKFVFNQLSAIGKSIVILSTGKVLLTGKVTVNGEVSWIFIRLNQNGTLDSTWGTAGVLIIDAGGGFDEPSKVLELPNGKILVAGIGSTTGNGSDFTMMRLQSNGVKDNLFGIDGVAHHSVVPGSDEAMDVAVTNEGKIFLSGRASDDMGRSRLAITRYNSNGSVDNTFGASGKVILQNDEIRTSQANSLVVDGNNIYTTGLITFNNDPNNFMSFVAKFDLSGNQVFSFGNNGIKLLDLNSTGNKIIRHFNGTYIIAGFTNFDASLINMDADGNLVPTFGDFGKMIIQNSTAYDELNDIVEKGNFIYAVGTGLVSNLNDTDMFILKLVDPLNTKVDDEVNVNFSVYPNPINKNQSMTIESDLIDYEVKLSDMIGKNYPLNRDGNMIQFSSNIQSGIYLLTFSSPEKKYTKKVVVE